MRYQTLLQRYTDDLASRAPVPGGGSAAALAGSLGASLVSMVIHFTLGKPRYAAYQRELKAMLACSEKSRKEFLKLIDLDVQAFRSHDMKRATEVPLLVCRLSLAVIGHCAVLVKKGNRNLLSDVLSAAVFLEAACSAAAVNVRVNLPLLSDRRYAEKTGQEVRRLVRRMQAIRRRTEEDIGKIIGRKAGRRGN